jgi:hypothetical protein
MELSGNLLSGLRARKSRLAQHQETIMTTADSWGPFALDTDDCERRARLRSLRAIVRLLLGPRGAILERALTCAETGAVSLETLQGVLAGLPSLDFRKVLASYAALTRPTKSCRT